MRDLIKQMFVFDECPHIQCPFLCGGKPCQGTPHISSTLIGRNVPPASTSGPGLIVEFACENEHVWQLLFVDHSGSTWIEAVEVVGE